ncbi:MAG: hypothetical protein L0G63_02055 [Psychrobacter sp.]|uniref:hypothetical protein n=1 Tax=Psychrobacter sp. TaxID=56811 RepID=UPI002647029C|nr:hypothetical protein [Psychrobacter sp.]MDN5619252.1 hypothetical protein [Psychrobacter sp.]
MNDIAQALCFISLLIAAVYLEVNGFKANGLWILIVVWAVCGFSSKHQYRCQSDTGKSN